MIMSCAARGVKKVGQHCFTCYNLKQLTQFKIIQEVVLQVTELTNRHLFNTVMMNKISRKGAWETNVARHYIELTPMGKQIPIHPCKHIDQ